MYLILELTKLLLAAQNYPAYSTTHQYTGNEYNHLNHNIAFAFP